MNAKRIGELINKHRKKCGLTQSELAERLHISDKTVSRWETGLGYPEITQFPALAEVFGVSIDYLITGNRKGIGFAGNILIDFVKTVEKYPEKGMLANILDISRAVGGSVPNTAINLAKIDRSVPLSAIGKVGDDENGRFVISEMRRYGIDCENVIVSGTKPTSIGDVISALDGERTILHYRGSNAEFSPADINISALNCSILHIGYIFLLDKFDEPDAEYGTVMARFLHDVKEAGIKTSIDVVSDSSADYKALMVPALRYTDYAILNEVESSLLSGLPPYDEDGKLCIENIKRTMMEMASYGVSEKIIVHCKSAGFCYDVKSGEFTVVPSLKIPKEEIKGSVGAGDAFCAASLYGIYNNESDRDILAFASAAAACNLFAENSVDGMRSKAEIQKMEEKYGRREL